MSRSVLALSLVLAFAGCGTTRTSGRILGGSMIALGGMSYLIADGKTEAASINDGIRQDLDRTGGLLFMVTGAVILAINELRPLDAPPPAVSTSPE